MKQENKEEKVSENATYSHFILNIKLNLEVIRKDSLKAYESYLKSLDLNTRHSGVLPPIKNFVVKEIFLIC
jgi:hypothetical protein